MQKSWMVGIAGVGLMLSMTGASVAQRSSAQMQPTEPTPTFHRIDQPIGLKTAVTVGGIGLIGVELWWFLFSKSRRTETPVDSESEP